MATKQQTSLKLNTTIKVKVEQGGRIVIPAEFRKQLGIKSGDIILMTLSEEDTLQIRTYPAMTRRIQAWVRSFVPDDVSLVDELLEDRRKEVAEEEAEYDAWRKEHQPNEQ